MSVETVSDETMLAAVWSEPGKDGFRLESLPRPVCGPEDVLIRVRRCFFSAMYTRAILVGHARLKGPTVFGRMLAGDIVTVGDKVDARLYPGLRVTVNPECPCGECFYCRKGMSGHCLQPNILEPGGMAELVRVPAVLVPGIFPLQAHVPYEHAAFAETLACVLQGMEVAAIRPGDAVVILGAGGVGLCFAQLALARGASQVWVVGRSGAGRQAIIDIGATPVTGMTDLPDTVREATQGHGADVVIEAAGSPETYARSLPLLRNGGTAVAFGGLPPGSRLDVDINHLHYASLRLLGSYRYRPEHFEAALALISKGEINLTPVVTHSLPFERVTEDAVNVQQMPDCKALVITINQED